MKWLKYGIPVLLGIGAFAGNWFVLKNNTQGQDVMSVSLVRVKNTIKAGAKIDSDSLEEIRFQGQADDLKKLSRAAVLFSEVSVIVGQVALRDLKSSDLVFWKDVGSTAIDLGSPALHLSLDNVDVNVSLLNVGDDLLFLVPHRPQIKPKKTDKIDLPLALPAQETKFDPLGPFRILSVGETVARNFGDSIKQAGTQRMITLAVVIDQNKSQLEGEDNHALKLIAALESSAAAQSKKVKVVQIPQRDRAKK